MRISIITASYNVEKVIGNTIESVLNQNFKDFEYIFIDGASKDNTNKIIEEYCKEMDNIGISYIHVSEPDNGISDAFSKGVRLAKGEVIAILNAGDQMLPNTLQYLDENFDKDIDVLYGNIIWHDKCRKLEYVKKSKSPEHLNELKYSMVIKHPATYIRKSAYEKYGVYDQNFKYAMDTDLLLRMYLKGAKFKYVDREFTFFEAGGVSDTNIEKVLKEVAKIAHNAGENDLVIYFKLLKKYIHHNLAHFIRYNFMKKIS